MDFQLNDRVAVVVGGSRGIGAAITSTLANEGAKVVAVARNSATLEESTRPLADAGRQVEGIPADAQHEEDLDRVLRAVLRRHGRIDAVVACTGSAPAGRLRDTSAADWQVGMDSKLAAHVRVCRVFLPELSRAGDASAVLIGGNAGTQPAPWEVVAGAVNAAVGHLASSLAVEYGSLGVRVNSVHPGPITTDRWQHLVQTVADLRGHEAGRVERETIATIPARKLHRPQEVADVVTFLISPRSRAINGAAIVVDGAQLKGANGL